MSARRIRQIPLERSVFERRRDRLSESERSELMSRIGSTGTRPERAVKAMLDAIGIPYRCQARDLPGRPDFVVDEARVCVMVDGDFWHGWRFDAWKGKLSPGWRAKIAANRRRDARNRRLLRADGWRIVRLWEHSVKRAPARCRRRLRAALAAA